MEELKTIYNIAKSLAEILNLKIERLDIQRYEIPNVVDGYTGYMYTENITYRIHGTGTIELVQK